MGVDEFGREHFVAEAPAGRLGILLVENGRGFVIVRGFDRIHATDQGNSNEADKERHEALRGAVREGDRLIAVDGDDVAHSSLSEVIARLGRLSTKKRYLKFARYHQTQFSIKSYDPEKLVLVRAPSGPLGLILSDTVCYGAVIEDFHQLPESHFKDCLYVHRGCQIVNINGVDVSGKSREEVTNLLAGMKEQDKDIVLYRMTPRTCARFSSLETSSVDTEVSIAETDNFRCVVASIGAAAGKEVVEGDILIGINCTDVTSMSRLDAVALLNQTPYPKVLTFYHPQVSSLPECHILQIDAGPSGLNLDSNDPNHARITGFTTSADADRPACKEFNDFVPGSYIIAINGLEVHHQTLEDISKLFAKFRDVSKQIMVANESLMRCLGQTSEMVVVSVPPGPLGIKFDGGQDDVARVAGFNPMANGKPGVIEQSRRVQAGSILMSINKMDVSCLTLTQTVGLLQKLSSSPKQLAFSTRENHRASHSRTVSIRVPPGPLGIDLKTSTTNRAAVDRANEDPTRGPTHIFNHGGVVNGSKILAIDGLDVSSLPIAELSQILRLFASHEKVITFSTTSAAYENMLNPVSKPGLKNVVVSKSPMGIEFDSSLENAACTTNVVKSDTNDEIPLGSRLIAIDDVDVRALSLSDIIEILKSLAGIQNTLTFDTRYLQSAPVPPSTLLSNSPVLKTILKGTSDAVEHDASPSKLAVRFVGVDSAEQSTTKAPPTRPPLLQIEPIAPPSPQSIRTVETTTPTTQTGSSSMKDESDTNSTTFMITMASWSGTRSSSRLVVNKLNKCVQLLPLDPSSPRSAKTSVIAFSDISALDTGKASPPSPSKKKLFRSLSVSKDVVDRYSVVISAVKTSKSSGEKTTKVWEFDMISSADRDELEALLLN